MLKIVLIVSFVVQPVIIIFFCSPGHFDELKVKKNSSHLKYNLFIYIMYNYLLSLFNLSLFLFFVVAFFGFQNIIYTVIYNCIVFKCFVYY